MITRSAFRPAWWLPGPHWQTLFPSLFRPRRPPPLSRERLELPDGDFLDLEWTGNTPGSTVLILHGLEGSLESHYTGGMLAALAQQGYNACMMYLRGCSGEPNRLAYSYHSGKTGDLDFVVRTLQQRLPEEPLAIVGFSLGGNILLKWLGEQGQAAGINTAVAISVPFDLNQAALRLEHGLSRIYQHHLVKKLHAAAKRKSRLHTLPWPAERIHELRTFRRFDNEITAPLNGFRDVDDYYTRASSKQYLKSIQVPTLLIQARDDPFLPTTALPQNDDLSPYVTLELSRRGGHVGFVSGNNPLQPHYWLEQRVIRHLGSQT
ncbi:MAG TPA: hydrolase [Gammaproteobacteria bacterium]|nr:hydrolase [Gammaproteobacteria bacterium]